ncbi:hypothetical protein GCWU000246_00821 [Jonquetella anthropi E3_33 E1]|nr:hypothetical protein GCWU000246_00821 [Jonquetella anthropi E3_33 E1]
MSFIKKPPVNIPDMNRFGSRARKPSVHRYCRRITPLYQPQKCPQK